MVKVEAQVARLTGEGGYSKFGGGRGGFRNNQRSTDDDAATTGPAITIPVSL